jgi:hypothetical protein
MAFVLACLASLSSGEFSDMIICCGGRDFQGESSYRLSEACDEEFQVAAVDFG